MAARRQPLTRPRIYAAALQLIAEQGIAQFSMRNVAQRLGVEAMALYKHVASKAVLLDGLAVLFLQEIRVPDEGDWAARLRVMAHSYRRVALAHPQLYPVLVSRPLPAEAEPILQHMWRVLGDAGLGEERRLVALRTLSSYLVGFTLAELVGGAPASEAETTPLARPPSREENDRLFDQGLDVILAGLQAPLDHSPRGRRAAPEVDSSQHPTAS